MGCGLFFKLFLSTKISKSRFLEYFSEHFFQNPKEHNQEMKEKANKRRVEIQAKNSQLEEKTLSRRIAPLSTS